MAINDIIKLKGESALVIAEATVAANARGITIVLARLLDSSMFVVIRNGFIQRYANMDSATLDIRAAYGEFSRCVEEAVLTGR
jgi:hypothetical protein